MIADPAARRWARSLAELAVDAGVADAVGTDLNELAEALSGEGAALLEALSSPVFTLEERKGVLGALYGKLAVQDLTKAFLGTLAEYDRMGLLPGIHAAYTQIMDDRAGRVRVAVSTVDPLPPALEAELKLAFEKATGKTILLETSLDPSLIGGLVAKVGSRVYDASLRTRLQDIKTRLIHAQAPAEA